MGSSTPAMTKERIGKGLSALYKMSSPYATLGNRTLDQWKVTELKEELKKRKLPVRGLKEDLIKRLDEAVRDELQSSTEIAADDVVESEIPSEQAKVESAASRQANDVTDIEKGTGEKIDTITEPEINDHGGSLAKDKVVEVDVVQESTEMEGEGVAAVETTTIISETVETVKTVIEPNVETDGSYKDGDSTAVLTPESLPSPQEDAKVELSDDGKQLSEISNNSMPVAPPSGTRNGEAMDLPFQMENDNSSSILPDSTIQPLQLQVPEVEPDLGFQVSSDSVSTESISIIEKNELKVDVITDNVQLELDVNHEMVQPPPGYTVPDDGKSHPMDVTQPHDKIDNEVPLEKHDVKERIGNKEVDNSQHHKDVEEPDSAQAITENVSSLKNIDSGDLGSEKLNLDRSSGDDSMEEDVLETKLLDFNTESNKVIHSSEKSQLPTSAEDDHVDVVGHYNPTEAEAADVGKGTISEPVSVKRKFLDKEPITNNETAKKVRRWNAESVKGSDTQSGSVVPPAKPKISLEPTVKRSSGTDAVNEEVTKERVVPPSPKAPTNSLRIDRFLRPFTLKAVQELLSRTGSVTSFWMDNIKTHCFVSYSSVEEAAETRNAVYNLQWPPNGGRLLVAEFVDPQEVKARLDAPITSPASNAAPIFTNQTQPIGPPLPSPHLPIQRSMPPVSLPPPPPLNPLAVRERFQARPYLPIEQPPQARDRFNLPPPPPLPEKVDPPIVTLDDLFRKTKSTPRIYYLPLSDEQVAAKLKTSGNNVNQ